MTVYRTLDGDRLPWDEIRERPTMFGRDSIEMALAGGSGVHESLLRSFHVVQEVERMLDRGDSPETVREFVRWATAREARG